MSRSMIAVYKRKCDNLSTKIMQIYCHFLRVLKKSTIGAAVHHRGHGCHLSLRMDRPSGHRRPLRCRQSCVHRRDRRRPAHLCAELHSVLLHLCVDDYLQAPRPALHGAFHLVRPVADGHPRAMADVEDGTRLSVVQLSHRLHHRDTRHRSPPLLRR